MAAAESKRINLALQGGGSHGAFTWGVLDRLLQEPRLEIEALSGTSAGAMNAAMLVQGYARGGREGARAALADFWNEISRYATFSPFRRGPLELATGSWNIDAQPAARWVGLMDRLFTPFQRNPFGIDPLRQIVQKHFDAALLSGPDAIKLFVTATDVQRGQARVFDNFERRDITLPAMLASACLPQLNPAVMIDGRPYWDGGYMGNPSLWPFIYQCSSRDIVVIQVNPLQRPGVPDSVSEIDDRLNEITFNAMLMAEIRAISFVQRLVDDPATQGPLIEPLRHMLIHIIADEAAMQPLGSTSKLNVEAPFLHYLRELGIATAERWLAKSFDDLGVRTSVDLRAMFTEAKVTS